MLVNRAQRVQSIKDSATTRILSRVWLGSSGRDPEDDAERRAEALLGSNRGVLRDLGVTGTTVRRSGRSEVLLHSSTRVGAIPLVSPMTGQLEYGLVVEPRFSWRSAGDMLAGTGFKVLPKILPLPELPNSERRVPPWVMSAIVIQRLRLLLAESHRRFTLVRSDLRAPKGRVDWGTYASSRLPHGGFLEIPCEFPDLRDDEELKSQIHWVVRRQIDSLLTQLGAGSVVRHLVTQCEELLVFVGTSPPQKPRGRYGMNIREASMASQVFRDGLQAMQWTAEERGLAGLSELSGLSWRMDMEVFFEAWVETIADHAAKRTGGTVRSGRKEETRVPLDWIPNGTGSQRSLLPDVVLQRPGLTVILDAKYKRHAEEIGRLGWSDTSDETRRQHRDDVLQALAYSTLFASERVLSVLVYPARADVWTRLKESGRVVSHARIRSSERTVELAIMAVPLSGDVAEASAGLESLIARAS